MAPSLPEGRYLSGTGVARIDSGGQTRAMLLRSRLISEATGRPVDVLCFDPYRTYDQVRANWYGTGLLNPDMRLLNIYEHYRGAGWGVEEMSGEPASRPKLSPPDHLEAVQARYPDGSPWRTSYRDPTSKDVVLNDFQRPDGSVFLRVAPYHTLTAEALPRELVRVGVDGEIVGRFTSLTEWYHRWIRDLTVDDPRTFLFVDSRHLMPIVAEIEDPSLHVIYLMHNSHQASPSRWDTPPSPDYRRCLERISDVAAFVTLTERQRADIALQWGPRKHLAVVPSPVQTPPLPEPLPRRDPNLVVLVARLERQKRIKDAIRVMERVRTHLPGARLDVHGSGTRQGELQEAIDRRDLSDVVTLRGYDPRASEALWTASAFLLTSAYEGYPLATLESLARGCPVVSYDIRYGPQEQISDGIDGFLVKEGDIAAAAARIVHLLSSPELVERMGRAGREKALLHSEQAFLHDWAQVLRSVVEQAPGRVRLRSVVAALDVQPTRSRLLGRLGPHPELRLSGSLLATVTGSQADPGTAHLSLEAVDDRTGEIVPVDLRVKREGLQFAIDTHADLRAIFKALPSSRNLRLRLRLTWENAYAETPISTNKPVGGPWLSQGTGDVVGLRRPVPLSSKAREVWRLLVPQPLRRRVLRMQKRLGGRVSRVRRALDRRTKRQE